MFRNDIRNGATSGNPVLPGPGRDARPELRRPLCRLKIGLYRRWRAGRRPPPTQATFPGWRRRTVGRRPSRRLKSAFSGAPRQASASADARNVPRLAQADRWPKAFTPIEIGLSRRDAPGVGLRRREERFSVGAGRPLAEGLRRPNSFGTPRAERQPPPTRGTFPGRRRPTVGRRPSRRLKSAFSGAPRQASASADAKNAFPVGAGRPSAEGLSRSNSFDAQGRPLAEGLIRSNSFDTQADRRPQASQGRIHPTRPGAPAPLWDRVVTAGMKRMATGDPFKAQPSSTEQSVASDGLIGVLRAARIKPAAGRQEGRDPPLIQADQLHRRPRREILSLPHPLTSLPQRTPPRALPAKPPATPAGGAPRTAPPPHPAACAPGDPAGR
jgi:hypothetical protein